MAAETQKAYTQRATRAARQGGRPRRPGPGGRVGLFLSLIAGGWSLFQVWYASPLPFILRFGLFNDTEARAIHLAIAIFLAFLVFPAFRSSSRRRVPAADWALAMVGAFCGSYLYLFYAELAQRPGTPTQLDLVGGHRRDRDHARGDAPGHGHRDADHDRRLPRSTSSPARTCPR